MYCACFSKFSVQNIGYVMISNKVIMHEHGILSFHPCVSDLNKYLNIEQFQVLHV